MGKFEIRFLSHHQLMFSLFQHKDKFSNYWPTTLQWVGRKQRKQFDFANHFRFGSFEKKCFHTVFSLQLIMSRVDPGLSEWGGFISHLRNKVAISHNLISHLYSIYFGLVLGGNGVSQWMRTQHWATIRFGSDNKTRILVIIVLAIVKELSHLATWQAQLETLKMDFQEKKVNKNSFIEECEVIYKLKEHKPWSGENVFKKIYKDNVFRLCLFFSWFGRRWRRWASAKFCARQSSFVMPCDVLWSTQDVFDCQNIYVTFMQCDTI